MKKAVTQRGLAKAGRWSADESTRDPRSLWPPWHAKQRPKARSAGKAVSEQITRHPDGRATVRVGTRELCFSSQIVAEQFLDTLANKSTQ